MATLIFLALLGLLVALAVWGCRRIRDDSRRGAAILTCALLALPAVFVVGGLSAVVANDVRLARFSRQLHEFPLPPGARLLATSSEVGVLTGNGDHCDFVATAHLRSDLLGPAIEAHYAGLRLRPAISGGAGAGLPAVEVGHGPSAGGRTYVVRAIDAPYEGIVDPRCH